MAALHPLLLLLVCASIHVCLAAVSGPLNLPALAPAWKGVGRYGTYWQAVGSVNVFSPHRPGTPAVVDNTRTATVLQIPAAPSRSVSRPLLTRRGCQYSLSFTLLSPHLADGRPTPLLASAVDVATSHQLAYRVLVNSKTRTFAPQSLSFLATGAATLITFSSVPLSSSSTQPLPLGPSISQLVVHAGTCGHAVPTIPPPPPPAALNAPKVFPAYPPPPPQSFYNMFASGKRVRMLPSMNPQKLKLAGNSATVTSGWALGGRWESSRLYNSGVFQAVIQCPENAAAFVGKTLSFMLDVPHPASGHYQRIGFEFRGNKLRTAIAVCSVLGVDSTQTLPLPFSCSDAPHTYTIYWDKQRVSWYVDQVWKGSVFASSKAQLPNQPLKLYGSLLPDVQSGAVQKNSASAEAVFKDVTALTPLTTDVPSSPSSRPLPKGSTSYPSSLRTRVMAPLAVDYGVDHCMGCVTSRDGSAGLRLDNSPSYPREPGGYSGARFRSVKPINFGLISANIKCPNGMTNGTVMSYYTSTFETSRVQDEIDFEWLLKDRKKVQTNYYVGGVGGHEQAIDLGFDCSDAFHNYALLWTAKRIIWYVDFVPVRVVTNITGKPYPATQAFVYASLWDASKVGDGSWAGARSADTYSDPSWSVNAWYKDMRLATPILV